MVLDTRGRGGGGGGSNTMADYCVQGSLQIRITIAPSFHLLSCNSSMLVNETSGRKRFINSIKYGNKIYLDKRCAFA